MPGKTLVVIGSKTKLGLAVARAFCVRGFTHIALLSDDIEQLRSDKDQVLDAIQERGYSCQVRTWTCQVDDVTDLERTLAETDTYGELECIFVDAVPAVDPDPAAEGFGRASRGLYEIALERLKKASAEDKSPSLFVIGASQGGGETPGDAQLARVSEMLHRYANDVHVGLLEGAVDAAGSQAASSDTVANRCWMFYKQPRSEWDLGNEIPVVITKA